MQLYLVKFAFSKEAPINYFLLDEQKHNDWCLADSGTEGYACFETIWSGDIEAIYTALIDINKINYFEPRKHPKTNEPSFMDLCVSEKIDPTDINKYIKKWHTADGTSDSIQEFLGMSENEYNLWLEQPGILPYLIEFHKREKES